MSLYPGLDRPRGPLYNKIWFGVFAAMVVLTLVGIYGATQYVDYVWRWNRVPQYFFYQEFVQIQAEIEGEVLSLDDQGKQTQVVVTGPDGEEAYLVPTDGLRVSEGDFIYSGDVLGASKQWKVGLFLKGLWMTLKVSFIAIFLGMAVGLLTGLARISDNPAFKWSAITYIELVRGSPLLVQLMVWYYVIGTLVNQVLANTGIPQVENFWYGVVGLAVFTGAYTAEIVRAGIQSINVGQMEAARSLGMSYAESMRKVIMPQALKRILPALAGQFISLIKDSSLLGVIAIRELTKITREVASASLMNYEMWLLCALLYLVLTFTLSVFVQSLERKAV
ncbi:amino acid ABC transporter permease [Desulfovibrio ferrophilus]|uniref:Putative glutamine transport system permease protein GlnP n=1 Tax=Desulfovibrio ferrophilus TaxID=241368 RepID=A0A2Z6AWH1_9BACT|nr:amino acid ABC transporter permease [Desulfovibrio ferrophilus]BBD07526.1 polar amino acid ABC transporter inner membrane subunit [Desulfovibrio ferrophilus]